MNLSEMTKYEKNKTIAELLNPKGEVSPSRGNGESSVFIKNPSSATDCKWVQDVNYYNNWNDLMPLIEKYRIIVVPYKDDLWEAYSEDGGFVLYNKKYKQTAADCLLLVLEAKHK